MTLWNVDKDGEQRKNPQPNVSNVLGERTAANTLGTTYRTDNNNVVQRVIFKNSLIISYDDMDRIIKIDGFEPRIANYPVVIQAKFGFDVYTDILGIPPPIT